MEPTTQPFAFTNLGGKKRVPQPEDNILGGGAPVYTFAPTKAKPASRSYYFQGQQPACGSHGGTSFVDSLKIQAGTEPIPYNSPQDVWINIKEDGTDPNDGTTMNRIFAVLSTSGTVPFEPLGNNVDETVAVYAEPSALTPEIIAQQNKVVIDPKSVAYLSDLSINGLKQAIHDYGAVLVLIDVCARFWTAADGTISWAPADILPLASPTAEFPVIDGHFMVLDYYDENYVYGPNSFGGPGTGGAIWGLDGDVQIGENYQPWILEAGVAKLLVPIVVPTPSAIETVQNALPQVQTALNHVSSLPEAQQGPTLNILQQLLADFEKLLTDNN